MYKILREINNEW